MIFSGAVTQVGASSVPSLSPRDDLIVVRVERGLLVAAVLGELRGRLVTVATRPPNKLKPNDRAIFFAHSWIHGRGIAVREVAREDISEEAAVAAAVAQLPRVHLESRALGAELVVDADVVRVTPAERTTFERNAALWAVAELKVRSVLQGPPVDSVMVYFPTSDHPLWARAPRFKEGQRGVFILRAPSRNRTPSEAALESTSWVALDPADFQPESQLEGVAKLLGGAKE